MADYETITVGAGDEYRVTLGDGDTLENKLIDITASGASYDIMADGSGWAIRNIGIVGNYDDGDGNADPFRLRVPDSGGTGTVENVCFETTTTATNNNPDYHHGATGIYVYRQHAGHINVSDVYIQNFPDNGVYASSPGHDATNAGGGTITVDGAYIKDCNTSGVRLGTTGSSVENATIAGGGHRGIWAFYEDTDAVNVDVLNNATDVVVGDSNYTKAYNSTITMTDSRWETEGAHGGNSTSNIIGDSVGTPTDSVPSGVPTTAKEAAAGLSGGDPEPDPRTEPDGYYETFPDGTAALDRYVNTSTYSIHTDNTLVSGYSLGATADYERMLTSEAGPERGTGFGVSHYVPSDSVGAFMFHFAASSTSDGWERYAVKVDHEAGQLAFGRFGPGGEGWVKETPFDTTGSGGQWNDILVDFGATDSDMISYEYADHSDNSIVHAADSVTHTELDSGGWGWSAWSPNGNDMSNWRGDALRGVTYTAPGEGEDYTVVELAEAENLRIEIGDGESVENVLYDASADGASVTIETTGSDWAIKKVGVQGRLANDDPFIRCSEPSSIAQSQIDTVYVGDGTQPMYDAPAIELKPDHAGDLTVENVYVDGCGPYAVDASGGDGTVALGRCYSADAGTAHFRLGKGRVDASVTHDDERSAIGVHAYPPGPVTISRCHLNGDDSLAMLAGADNAASRVIVDDTQYAGGYDDDNGSTFSFDDESGTQPQHYVPETCPETPQEAAANTAEPTDPSGDVDPFPAYSGPTPAPAVWVNSGEIQGDVTIRNTNIQRHDGPGIVAINDRTGTGLLEVRDSYLANNGEVNLAIGTRYATDHATVVVSENTLESFTLATDDVIAHTTFDCTASGADLDITLAGDGAAVRNVTILGDVTGPAITADLPSGATGAVEECHLVGGGTGLSVASTNAGELRVKHSALLEWTTAIDATNDAGAVDINECWFVDNGSHVEIGSDLSVVRHSVFWQATGSGNGIAAYTYDTRGEIEIRNCDFTWDGGGTPVVSGDGTGKATLDDCRFSGSHPDTDDVIAHDADDPDDPDATEPEDYDVITVPAGETYSTTVGTGETWENKLIDVTATGASYDIRATGTDWTIQDIGVDGSVVGTFEVEDTDPDGQSTIDHVYLPTDATITVLDGSEGTISITRVNVNGDSDAPDTATTAATGGTEPGSGGYDQIDFGDPTVEPASAVPTSPARATKTTTVDNVHIREDGTAAGLRAAHGTVTVIDSQVQGNPPREAIAGGQVRSVGSAWGADANPMLDDAVPASAVEASDPRISDRSDPS